MTLTMCYCTLNCIADPRLPILYSKIHGPRKGLQQCALDLIQFHHDYVEDSFFAHGCRKPLGRSELQVQQSVSSVANILAV